MQGKWNVGSEGNSGISNKTSGSSGKFQRMIPPCIPPQWRHPTKTGTTVVLPCDSVEIHVLPVQRVLVVASVENPGGEVVIVVVGKARPLRELHDDN